MGRHHLDEIDLAPGTAWLPRYRRAERGWWYRGRRRMAKGRLSVDDLVRDNPQSWRFVHHRTIKGGQQDLLLPTPEWMFDSGPGWRELATNDWTHLVGGTDKPQTRTNKTFALPPCPDPAQCTPAFGEHIWCRPRKWPGPDTFLKKNDDE